jgi:hypothetical protein
MKHARLRQVVCKRKCRHASYVSHRVVDKPYWYICWFDFPAGKATQAGSHALLRETGQQVLVHRVCRSLSKRALIANNALIAHNACIVL